jgi:hypothetical protein
MWVMWNLILFHYVTVLVSLQDRWTICAKRKRGLEIILDEAQVETRLVHFDIVLVSVQK